MGSRAWVFTGALTVTAVGLAALSVVEVGGWSTASRQDDDALVGLEDELASGLAARGDLDRRRAVLDTEEQQVTELRRYFTPRVLGVVVEVQEEAARAACAQGRAATRDGTEAPRGESVLDAEVAAARSADEALVGLDGRWRAMLQPGVVQAEIDRCVADEAARIEAERQAAAAEAASSLDTCEGFLNAVNSAGRPPTSGEVMYLYIECGIDIYA